MSGSQTICPKYSIDPFTKCHKLVHNGGFPKVEVLRCSQNTARFIMIKLPLTTRYNLPNHKISGELKSYNSFWMYPPLWTSLLVVKHDNNENTSITDTFNFFYPDFKTKQSNSWLCLEDGGNKSISMSDDQPYLTL